MMKQLVLLPVAPARFTVWVMEQVAQDVDHRLYSPQAHMQRLREIAEARERGELHEDHAAELEAQTIEQASAPLTIGSSPTAIEQEEGAENDRRR
jgi:hypothetical protein